MVQGTNRQILEETREGIGVPKGKARGVFYAINGGHQTDQVVGGRLVRHT